MLSIDEFANALGAVQTSAKAKVEARAEAQAAKAKASEADAKARVVKEAAAEGPET